jgi:S-adenosylmethionine/arginine decarboxylase-like enzyme
MADVKQLKILGLSSPSLILLDDPSFLSSFVVDLIESLGMTLLGEVTTHDVLLDISKLDRRPFEDEGGVTCQAGGYCQVSATLSTSHVAIHSWPLRGEFHLDVYSCRSFPASVVKDLVVERLNPTKIRVTDLTFALAWDGEIVSGPTF